MHPVLFSVGGLTLYTYGFFVAMGFLAGIVYARWEARRMGLDAVKIMDLAFFILVAGIVGARLFYVFTNPRVFLSDPLEIVRIWNGGLVFYGGFLASLATALLYMNKQAMPVWKIADIAGPTVALGHFLGRIGCFFAGCCYGASCDHPWAIVFRHPESLAPLHVGLHPVQLYGAAGNLILFVLMVAIKRRMTFDGQLFWIYIMLYGVGRFVVEFLRGDDRGAFLLNTLSVSQTIAIVMVIVSGIMLSVLARNTGKSRDNA